MTENHPKQHGGRRPGAGRKPSLKPLAIIRLPDPDVRAALVAVTVHQRQLSGNPQLSQEQIVAELIQAAQRQLEKHDNQTIPVPAASTSEMPALIENINNQDGLLLTPPISTTIASLENTNNQILSVELAATAAAITTFRQEINALVATLRTKRAVGQRDGKRLLALLHQLIDLHAAQIAPWAILEELNRPHHNASDRDQAIASLHQRPLVEYRQDGWLAALDHVAGQLASGPIRRQADQWDCINLAVEISGTTLVTNDRIADLIERLHGNGINPQPWLDRADQAPTTSAPAPPLAPVSAQRVPVVIVPPAPPAAITGVGLPRGKSHYLGAVGRTLCGHALPPDLDDVTWIRDPAFVPTCRRCRALFHPTLPLAIVS